MRPVRTASTLKKGPGADKFAIGTSVLPPHSVALRRNPAGLTFRSIVNDDGHFHGLEVMRG